MFRLVAIALLFTITQVSAVELPPTPRSISSQKLARIKASPDAQHLVFTGGVMSCNDAQIYNKTHDLKVNRTGCQFKNGGCVEGSCRIGKWVNGWE